MRLVEKCSCGASIEVSWEEPHRTSYSRSGEGDEARKQIATFRRAHRSCLSARSGAGSPIDAGGIELDAEKGKIG